jgi:phosphatidylinositol-3-phosphatase
MIGPMIKSGVTNQKITHYSILRTIEEMYHLPLLGYSQSTKPIEGVWR